MKALHFFLAIAASMAIFTSCSQQDYLYLTDMADNREYPVSTSFEPRVQPDDQLLITVSCKNPELAKPFNVTTGMVNVSSSGNVSSNGDAKSSYRVTPYGDINFPVLGEIHVAGLTLAQVSELIRDLIIKGAYIKDPIVTVDFRNFRYTVLGAANGNGTYSVENGRVTILDAIARAGDLSTNADLGKIAVIRELDGKRKVYTVDIRKTDIFESPAFYLAQNDIVYVRPKKPKSENKANFIQWTTLAISLASVATSIVWLATRNK